MPADHPELDAKLIFSTSEHWPTGYLKIPERMGTPREDQLVGTVGERLGELCGRICYDSLGTKGSRNSTDYHAHILEVNNTSVYEHFSITVELDLDWSTHHAAFFNRRGVYVGRLFRAGSTRRVTFNPRVVLDWDSHGVDGETCSRGVGEILSDAMHSVVPQIVREKRFSDAIFGAYAKVVIPYDDNEIEMSVYMRGSRGFSHEKVRHRTAISQRSTRYVDESLSKWIPHPQLKKLFSQDRRFLQNVWNSVEAASKSAYAMFADALFDVLTKSGVEKTSARKQARGAARGILGNALPTEGIFTGSIKQWKWEFKNRAANAADGEICEIYMRLWDEIQNSPLKVHFEDWAEIEDRKDGCGTCLRLRQ